MNANAATQTDDEAETMRACVASLGALRDLERPWTMVVNDPSGSSRFVDMTGVTVKRLEQ